MRYNEKVIIIIELEEIDKKMTVEELITRMGCNIGSNEHRSHIIEKFRSLMYDELSIFIKSLDIEIESISAHNEY